MKRLVLFLLLVPVLCFGQSDERVLKWSIVEMAIVEPVVEYQYQGDTQGIFKGFYIGLNALWLTQKPNELDFLATTVGSVFIRQGLMNSQSNLTAGSLATVGVGIGLVLLKEIF